MSDPKLLKIYEKIGNQHYIPTCEEVIAILLDIAEQTEENKQEKMNKEGKLCMEKF